MKKKFGKLGHTIIVLLCVFLAFATCLLANQLLDRKIQKQEVQSLQTIYDALYNSESSPTPEESIE